MKIPRKQKKAILGKRLSKAKIRRLIKNFSEDSDLFCPKCGCKESISTHNMVEYPEVWIKHYCMRCSSVVAYQDNGPYTHCLEELKEME